MRGDKRKISLLDDKIREGVADDELFSRSALTDGFCSTQPLFIVGV